MNSRKDYYRIGHSIETYDISEGRDYCSNWGLVDLYEECEKNLRELLDLGKDFCTEWCGSKKELLSARYRRIGNTFTVQVEAWMDDLWDGDDLVYDAIDEILHDEEAYPLSLSAKEKLRAVENADDPAFIDEVKEIACDASVEDRVTVTKSFPSVDAHYDTVMDVVSELEDYAADLLKTNFYILCGIVAEVAREV